VFSSGRIISKGKLKSRYKRQSANVEMTFPVICTILHRGISIRRVITGLSPGMEEILVYRLIGDHQSQNGLAISMKSPVFCAKRHEIITGRAVKTR